jgi:hypothetical protein
MVPLELVFEDFFPRALAVFLREQYAGNIPPCTDLTVVPISFFSPQ